MTACSDPATHPEPDPLGRYHCDTCGEFTARQHDPHNNGHWRHAWCEPDWDGNVHRYLETLGP